MKGVDTSILKLNLNQMVLGKLCYFDESLENRIYVAEHNGTILLITCQVLIGVDGILSGININGYDLHKFKRGFPDSRPLVHIRSFYEWHRLPNMLWIEDCRVIDEEQRSKGYGSILMEQFLDCAKHLGVDYIAGDFSSVDATAENKDRRHHFYAKYGFSIDGAKIRLDLKK